jgi:DNA-binding phage protein
LNERKGWIKVHRKILDNPVVFKDADHFAVWMYLLLEATRKEYPVIFGGEKIMLKPGQLTKGRSQIARETGVEQSKVYRILKSLKNEQQIEQQTSNKCTLITVLNWETYQGDEQQPEQQLNNNRTTTEQQLNTKQEEKKKRIKEEKIIYAQSFEVFWEAYPRKRDKGNAYKKYNARLKSGFSEAQLLEAAEKYAEECKANGSEEKYIKHASTFLSDSTPFVDYLNKKTEIVEEESTEEFYRKMGFPDNISEIYTDDGTVWEVEDEHR